MRSAFNKLFVTTMASAMFATSAFAGCGCNAQGGIPASALLPAIPFGQNVTIGTHKAMRTVKTRKAQAASAQGNQRRSVQDKTVQAQTAHGMIHCLSGNGGSGSWTVQWIKEGNGRCPGQILASDAVKLARLAEAGKTDLRVAFYIPEKCPKTQWASFPVKAENGKLNMYPWRKLCSSKGYFPPYAK